MLMLDSGMCKRSLITFKSFNEESLHMCPDRDQDIGCAVRDIPGLPHLNLTPFNPMHL